MRNTNNIFSVRLDNETRCELDELSARHRCTRGFTVRMLISREAKQRGIVIPQGQVPIRTPELRKQHEEWLASKMGGK